jgi:uncharacterized membrane protein YtjA (UPF0391 family)
MLSWAIFFIIAAVLAAVLGFSGVVVGTLAWAAKVFVGIFIVLFLVSLLFGRGRPDPYV